MSKKKGEDALCIEYKEKVTSKQYSVACCVCERWVHKDCGIDDDKYKLIDKIFKKKGSHFWSCDGCSLGLSKLQIIAQLHISKVETMDHLKNSSFFFLNECIIKKKTLAKNRSRILHFLPLVKSNNDHKFF